MNSQFFEPLEEYCQVMARQAKMAAAGLATVSGKQKNEWLKLSAIYIRQRIITIMSANTQDLTAASDYNLSAAQVDRLRLTPERLSGIADSLEEIALLPDPVGRIISSTVRPNGLEAQKVRVPLGVIFFIYESRPNVTVDSAALCIKSGNAVILRGGKEALHSSSALVKILSEAALEVGLPPHAVQMVQTTDRQAVGEFLRMPEFIDVCIPRGGKGLIQRVVSEAKMPVLKHFDGNCHVYVDESADIQMATEILINAKCQRMGVCNAAESLVIHRRVRESGFSEIMLALQRNGIEILGDAETCQYFSEARPASEQDFYTEYSGPKISCKIVGSLEEAITHINHYSSGHTEAIITQNLNAAREFAARVDSSAIMINTSTRFNDGGELGLGAEIGISTDKFHARGPCGLEELTSYKYVVYGNGQIRE
ncbi:MAG: glutamate-5-semialdehyde dehydrogenase [Planctomycetia bacterium]|nr:glutamate-5-semialdehyde dehydrogenase [Planctomycetia bacterium]